MRGLPGLVGVLCLLVGVARAEPEPDVGHEWEVGVSGSAATGGPYGGWVLDVAGMHGQGRYLSLGAAAELLDVNADGVGDFGSPASVSVFSLAGVFALRGRVPIGIVTPYLEGRIGAVIVNDRQSVNQQCNVGGGPIVAAGTGVDVAIGEGFVVGLRGEVRNLGVTGACFNVGGPWGAPSSWLYELGAGVGRRW